jgi:hypothetical protein
MLLINEWHVEMKISFVSILLGLVLIVSTSAQAWTSGEKWTDEKSILDSIPQFVCDIMDSTRMDSTGMVSAGSEDQSEEEEEEDEPDCD